MQQWGGQSGVDPITISCKDSTVLPDTGEGTQDLPDVVGTSYSQGEQPIAVLHVGNATWFWYDDHEMQSFYPKHDGSRRVPSQLEASYDFDWNSDRANAQCQVEFI